MGQITATRNLVAIKVVRHAGQWRQAELIHWHCGCCEQDNTLTVTVTVTIIKHASYKHSPQMVELSFKIKMDHLCILESVQQHVNSLNMVYHRVLLATSWLVTIRVWIDGYHIISVEDITKSYEISWKENMNGKFPWYCIGHKICQHQWLININLSFFFLEIYIVSQVSVSRYTCVSVPICIVAS